MAPDGIRAGSDEKRLLDENRRLRRALAEFGIDPGEEHRPGETLQQENQRLQADLGWYLALLRDVN